MRRVSTNDRPGVRAKGERDAKAARDDAPKVRADSARDAAHRAKVAAVGSPGVVIDHPVKAVDAVRELDEARVGSRESARRAVGAAVPEPVLVATGSAAVIVVHAAMTPARAAKADSASVQTMVASHARRASARSGATGRTVSVMRDGRAATRRDGVSAHRWLDRGDRRRHVQWQE